MGHKKFYMVSRCVSMLLFAAMFPACSPDRGLDAEFRSQLDALDSGVVRFRKATSEIDYLSARIRVEGNSDRRNAMFAAYSNTVINIPIVKTNNFTREKFPRRGVIQGPYRYAVSGYRDFVNAAFEKVIGTNMFDHFCLELEIWKRLDRELARSDELMDMVARASVEYSYEALAYTYKHDAKSSLEDGKHEIEDHLERLYRIESDESRRAYELFRKVIGREAKPCYKQ